MEEDPSERNVARFTRAEEQFRLDGGYAAESEVRRLAAGLGLADDRLDLPDRRAVGRRAAPGGAGPHPVRRQRRAAARRADQPPRHRRQGLAARLPARLPRRAARHQPRPRPARRGHHPGAAPRPGGRRGHRHAWSSTRAPTRSTSPSGRRTRSAWPRRPPRQAKEIDRLQTLVDRFGAKATKASMAHSLEKRIARIEAGERRGPRAGAARSKLRFPAPPPRRPHRARGDGAGQVLRRPRRVRGRRPSTSAGASACSSWASTAPARPACCGSSPA